MTDLEKFKSALEQMGVVYKETIEDTIHDDGGLVPVTAIALNESYEGGAFVVFDFDKTGKFDAYNCFSALDEHGDSVVL